MLVLGMATSGDQIGQSRLLDLGLWSFMAASRGHDSYGGSWATL